MSELNKDILISVNFENWVNNIQHPTKGEVHDVIFSTIENNLKIEDTRDGDGYELIGTIKLGEDTLGLLKIQHVSAQVQDIGQNKIKIAEIKVGPAITPIYAPIIADQDKGSKVSFQAAYTTGTKIGTITIDNENINVYVPKTESGGASPAEDLEIKFQSALTTGTEIGFITINDQTQTIYAPTVSTKDIAETIAPSRYGIKVVENDKLSLNLAIGGGLKLTDSGQLALDIQQAEELTF